MKDMIEIHKIKVAWKKGGGDCSLSLPARSGAWNESSSRQVQKSRRCSFKPMGFSCHWMLWTT